MLQLVLATSCLAAAFTPTLSSGSAASGVAANSAAAASKSAAIARRSVLFQGTVLAGAVLIAPPRPAFADGPEDALIAEITAIYKALDLKTLYAFIDEEKWDNVRSVLKVGPVNLAWEQSQNKKNPIRKLAELRDDIDLLETTDEIAAALQLADQYLYSNTFIYTQPGNGKVKIKEPKQQLQIAVDKMKSFTS